MANRYPLIIDTADGNKIKELPADDNLYLRNNSILDVEDINALGTINAAAITVAGQPLVAQSFTDLTDTPNNFSGAASTFLKVNSAGTAIEFASLDSLGTITVENITVVNNGDIIPSVTNVSDIGTSSQRFAKVYSTSLYGNLRGFDGTLVFDAATNRITYSAVFGAPTALSEFTNDMGFLDAAGIDIAISEALSSGSIVTDITGSLFSDDSSVMVDGINREIFTEKITYGDQTIVSYQDNTTCLPSVDTVVYTSSSEYRHALRLFAIVEGTEVGGGPAWETQSCDIIAVKGYNDDNITVSVFGITYSGLGPLATFDGRWNATTNRIEITCQPNTPTQPVRVSVHALEMQSND